MDPARLVEYGGMFVFVVVQGAGIPGPGDASLIAAGTAAGEGRLNIGISVSVALAAWMVGSLIGYEIGHHQGRGLLERRGRLEGKRRLLLAKGDRMFGRHRVIAPATLPAFLSGIFGVRFRLFVPGAVVAGAFWVGLYVVVSYFLGGDIAKAIGDAGSRALVAVALLVAIGLAMKFGWVRWRSRARVEAA